MEEKPLRLLIPEDSLDDAELMVLQLEQEGFTVEWRRVETEGAFRKALDEKPDLILSDYSIPSFSGAAALRIAQEITPEIPFIMVSGAIGEEDAVECMRAGATDYVLKNKLFRLGPVVKRALEEVEVQRDRKQAEEDLREAEEKYRMIVEDQTEFVVRFLPDGTCVFVNEAYCQYFGKAREELVGQEVVVFAVEEDREKVRRHLASLSQDNPVVTTENRVIKADGEIRWVQWTNRAKFDAQGNLVAYQSVGRDITERKQAEEALRQHQFQLTVLNRMGLALAKTLEIARVYRIAYEHVAEFVDCPCFGVSLYDSVTRTLRAEFMLSDGEALDTARFPPLVVNVEPMPGHGRARAIVTGQPEVMGDYRAALEDAKDSVLVGAPGDERVPRSALYVPMVLQEQVIGLLELQSYRLAAYDAEKVALLESVAGQIGLAIENARLFEQAQREIFERRQAEEMLRLSFIQLAETVARAMEFQDPYTAGHQRQVAELARAVGEKLGLDQERLQGLYIAGLLHDIGKISIPAEVLTHPGKLNDAEWTLIRTHPRRGYEILEQVEFPWPVADIALHHHERLDGTGYPDGLKDGELSLEVHILAVCDVVDAMSSDRPYRSGRPKSEVIAELRAGKGTKYDPDVMDVLIEIIESGEPLG